MFLLFGNRKEKKKKSGKAENVALLTLIFSCSHQGSVFMEILKKKKRKDKKNGGKRY